MKNSDRIIFILSIICFLLFTSTAILVSVHRYWQYEVFYYDFGIFDQAIWKVSRFQPPIIDHLVIGGKWIFADHFSPIIFLLSPLYWFSDKAEIILIAQAVIVGLSGLVLYAIGKSVLKNNLASLAVMVSYYLFIGLQNAVISDFHETTILTLPLMLTFWTIVKKKKILYMLFFIVTLSYKENSFLLGWGLSLFILMTNKSWWRVALSTFLASSVWGFLAIKVIIPYFSGGSFSYDPTLPHGLTSTLFTFFDNPIKRHTLWNSFASFLFLPLFSPTTWPLILQDLIARFIPTNTPLRWGLGLHYSAGLAPILGVGSIMTLSWIQKNMYMKKFLPIICLLLFTESIILHQFILHGPLGLSYNPAFYRHTKDFTFLNTLISNIPPYASVIAQNNIVSHFTHQQSWLLRDDPYPYNADYIVIDVRSGQNPNNFFGAVNAEGLLPTLLKAANYTIMYKTNDQYIFSRIK